MASKRTSRRPLRTVGALALTVGLAGAGLGCGSSDEEPTASTTGSTSTGVTAARPEATGGESTGAAKAPGTAPAANEDAIREALRRGPAASKAAKTARISTEQSVIGIETKGSGTIDLVDQRALLTQELGSGSGAAGGGGSVKSYVEQGKAYVQAPGSSTWSVTDTPAAASDPLAQVRALEKADIVDVGDTREYDGRTCREFKAEVSFKDIAELLGAAAKGALDQAPSDAKIPVTTCIDDSGLTYATESSFDVKDLLGDQLPDTGGAKIPTRTTSKVTISDYGTAPSPARPNGIDDAKPLTGGGLGGSTS